MEASSQPPGVWRRGPRGCAFSPIRGAVGCDAGSGGGQRCSPLLAAVGQAPRQRSLPHRAPGGWCTPCGCVLDRALWELGFTPRMRAASPPSLWTSHAWVPLRPPFPAPAVACRPGAPSASRSMGARGLQSCTTSGSRQNRTWWAPWTSPSCCTAHPPCPGRAGTSASAQECTWPTSKIRAWRTSPTAPSALGP